MPVVEPIGQRNKMTSKKPLTLAEIKDAADEWFPLFDEVKNRMEDGSSTECALQALEQVAKLASYRRGEADKIKRDEKFGFNKP